MKHTAHPTARSENLIVEELDGEVLVYDIDRDRAHCLNSTAALVWKLCNGRRTPGDIARELQLTTETRDANDSTRAIKASALKGTDELVWLALDQLSRDHLLDDKTFTASRVPLISRREAIRRVGIGAAIAIPVVASITAPTAVQAGSCKPSGAACGTGAQCCSGTCTNNSCL